MRIRLISIITLGGLLFSTTAEARGGWKKFWKSAAGTVVGAAGGAILQEAAVKSGYSREEAASFTRDVYNTLELNTRNADLGMAWNDAENKYEKQNVAKELVFDAAGNFSGNDELASKLRTMTDAQLSYLSVGKKATTQEERQVAFDTRTRAYADLFYDIAQEKKERQAVYLAEKMQIEDQLMKSGHYNDAITAEEVAGSIISIQKSKDFSDNEKEQMLRAYGFRESPEQIQQLVNEVLSGNYASATANDAEAERIKAEEAKRQAELERQQVEQKAAEERSNAIQKIETAKIDGYSFDETALSQSQKSELDAVIDVLKQYSDIRVFIVGHTCEIGYKSINLKKGLKRAEAGKEYLIEKGISPERISVDSSGEIQPFVQNLSEENRRKNRRIEFRTE
ncbi:MAG: OmpA family protein [Dysgonamonadaceae bacterium]|jgi:outer membrane protein OmpA-like peptidoglycan-associated protein|nr:OmpA family protein [Dysgonamonadaceae bacterium]